MKLSATVHSIDRPICDSGSNKRADDKQCGAGNTVDSFLQTTCPPGLHWLRWSFISSLCQPSALTEGIKAATHLISHHLSTRQRGSAVKSTVWTHFDQKNTPESNLNTSHKKVIFYSYSDDLMTRHTFLTQIKEFVLSCVLLVATVSLSVDWFLPLHHVHSETKPAPVYLLSRL